MSDSYGCEHELRKIAEELHAQAYDLETAADVLRDLREDEGRAEKIKFVKTWAMDWMKRNDPR